MGSYESLAGFYDILTTDVDYAIWADYLETRFQAADIPVKSVLDLACGTGSMSFELAARGYEVVGVDRSPDMLSVAASKGSDLPDGKTMPLFLCQSMDELDLYGDVNACVCCLDSVNYVTDPKVLQRAFERVFLFLTPGGVFVFDMDTPEKLRGMDDAVFLDEQDGLMCIWRGECPGEICTFEMDLFSEEEDGRYIRAHETHQEYLYTREGMEELLRSAGFVEIRQFGELKDSLPEQEEDRIFFVAKRPKNN